MLLTLSMQCYGEPALSKGIMRSMYINNVKIKGFFHLQHVTHDQLCHNRNYVQSMDGEEQMAAESIHTHKTFAYIFYLILTSSLPVLFSNPTQSQMYFIGMSPVKYL